MRTGERPSKSREGYLQNEIREFLNKLLNIQLTFNNSRNGDVFNADRPNLKPGFSNNPKLGKPERWFDVNALTLPDPGTYGNLGRLTVIAPGLANLDLSLNKTFDLTAISEGFRLQFRAEFFNILNRPNFGQPVRLVLTPTAPVANAGQITTTTTSSRQIQFGLKLSW